MTNAFDPNTYARCPGKPWAVFAGRVLLRWCATRREARWFAARDRGALRPYVRSVTVHKQRG